MKQLGDELDFAADAWLCAMNVASFDGSHSLNPAQGRLGRSQRSKALSVSKEPFQGGVVALDEIVTPLSIDMPDAVKMWVESAIDLANDALVRVDCEQACNFDPLEG